MEMEHTSKLIIGSASQALKGKKIALCVTGSVAAVECVALARKLMRHGAEIYGVMSEAAQRIIHPDLLEWAIGNPVVTELTGQIEHVTLAGKHAERVDLILIAPSTANTIGKIANGIDDTPVTTTVSSGIGAKIPVVVVPAMHQSMYDHPAVVQNIEKLKSMGVVFVEPRLEEAKAKIPTVGTIVSRIISLLGPKDLEGKHFVVSAGPTRGWVDRVRFITNPSSGKMGVAITEEILMHGGSVTLVLGPTSIPTPNGAEVVRVDTTNEMLIEVMEAIEDSDTSAFISAAAVLDYEPATKAEEKTPSRKDSMTVELVPTPKIIEKVREKHKELLIVGFKVESEVTDEELQKRASEKIESGICDLVVANDAYREGVAFGTDTNEVLIVGEKGLLEKVSLRSKREVATTIVGHIIAHLDG